jgi:hypothetical protein
MSDTPNIYAALSSVMTDVLAVSKTGRNTDQNYSFRGVDAVVNAVGPVLRKHHVLLLPELLDVSYRDVRTSRDKPAREVTVRVRYTFVGPAGDKVEVTVPGESMDNGDKGTAKAMSVAYRIALLQALCIPTDEPDPDEGTYERSYAPPVAPPDPLTEARIAVAEAWKVSHPGELDQQAVQVDFTDWTNGEHFMDATAERLLTYADHLKQEAGA